MNAETMNTETMNTETMNTETTNTDVNPKWRGCSPPSRAPLRAAIARPMIRRAVAGLPLRVQFPDGVRFGAGGATDPQMVVHRPEAFFARLASDAKIGFGEAYMAGDWDTGPGTDLADLLTPLARNVTTMVPPRCSDSGGSSSGANPLTNWARHRRRERTSTATTTCPTTCSRRSSTRRSATPRRCSRTATIWLPHNAARSTPSWTSRQWGPAAPCSRSGPGGASSPSRQRDAGRTSPRSRCPPSSAISPNGASSRRASTTGSESCSPTIAR